MGNIGVSELLVVAVIALLVFGPERLPELARQAGKMVARFKAETSKSMNELKKVADLQDLDRELRTISSDLRDVRSSVSRAITSGSPTGGSRPDDRPPPTDPDAT